MCATGVPTSSTGSVPARPDCTDCLRVPHTDSYPGTLCGSVSSSPSTFSMHIWPCTTVRDSHHSVIHSLQSAKVLGSADRRTSSRVTLQHHALRSAHEPLACQSFLHLNIHSLDVSYLHILPTIQQPGCAQCCHLPTGASINYACRGMRMNIWKDERSWYVSL